MGKRVLVTGGAGFIGHHLLDRILSDTDWELVCLDRLDHAGNLGRLAALESFTAHRKRCRVVFHDLRAAISPSVASSLGSFDYIAHLAAGSHVDRSVLDPGGFALDNVVGTINLLDWARTGGIKSGGKTLIFSTDEVFGPAGVGDLFGEGARLNPNNPYAATKAGGELMAPAYANTYGMRLQVTRCANVFGPRQDSEKFIPLVIRKVLAGETVQIHARWERFEVNGFSAAMPVQRPATRLYTYQANVTSAVLHVLEHGECIQGEDASSGRYNISGGEELSNLVVAQRIAALLGKALHHELVVDPPGRPKPDFRYAIDASKLIASGWAPTIGFEEGLAITVESELTQLRQAAE